MNGFFILDKSDDISSASALNPIKRLLKKISKVGHAGTLDPFATGVLLVLIGDCTRLSSIAMGLTKTYETSVRFGVQTDSHDNTGKVTQRSDPGPYEPNRLLEAIQSFEGKIEQVPPSFSAIKVNGVRSYRLARADRAVPLTPRTVDIHSVHVQQIRWPEVQLRIRCGTGTYIRAVGRDLGEKLGLPSSLTQLRRTAIGPFDVGAATTLRISSGDEINLDDLKHKLHKPIELIIAANIPRISLEPSLAYRFVNGQALHLPDLDLSPESKLAITFREHGCEEEHLLGLAQQVKKDVIRATSVLATARLLVDPIVDSDA
jgi:tRNA pseudouridine55 synthase